MIGLRRHVNVVAENYKSGVCSLHRLNVSEHFFYPSTAEAEATKPEVSRLAALPAPTFNFQSTPTLRRDKQLFALVSPRSSDSRILLSSPTENTLLYDLDSSTIYELSRLRYKGCHPITISIPRPDAPEEDLYIMSSFPYPNAFEVLRFGSHSNSEVKRYPLYQKLPETWQWNSLPPPPLPQGAFIRSHALLHDGRTICVTAASRGTAGTYTYYFDTVEHEWSRAPDGWDLPFLGGAEYIPDLRLWLGFTIDRHRLCLSDLSVDKERSPTLKHQWEGVQTPEEWQTVEVRLSNLGKGRFCIFKVIHEMIDKDWDEDYSIRGNLKNILALLSGVEINYSPEHGLRMVTHKTLSYIFNKDKINWVL